METPESETKATKRPVWNAGRTVGAKRALKPKQIWEIRFYLNQHRRLRDRALFDLAIDSKLRGCDLVQLKIADIVSGTQDRSVLGPISGPCRSRPPHPPVALSIREFQQQGQDLGGLPIRERS